MLPTFDSATAISQHQPLPSPMSFRSTLSRDSFATEVLSPLSVQTLDDTMDADTDFSPDSVCSSRQQWWSFRCRNRSRDDEPSSTNAHINLHEAHQRILELPQHQDKQLMMEVYGK